MINFNLGKFLIQIYIPAEIQLTAGWPIMLKLHSGIGFSRPLEIL